MRSTHLRFNCDRVQRSHIANKLPVCSTGDSDSIGRATLESSEAKLPVSCVHCCSGCANHSTGRDKIKPISNRLRSRKQINDPGCANHHLILNATSSLTSVTPSNIDKLASAQTKYSVAFLNELYPIPPSLENLPFSYDSEHDYYDDSNPSSLSPVEWINPLLIIPIDVLDQQCTALIDSGAGNKRHGAEKWGTPSRGKGPAAPAGIPPAQLQRHFFPVSTPVQ